MPTVRRHIAISVATALGIALCASALYAHWVLFEHRFATITPGQAYRSAAMPPERLVEKVEKSGIRAVIDLRSHGEDEAERSALAALGVKYFSLPSSQTPSPSVLDSFLELAAQSENRPFLVHCNHGIGRAVLFAALYRIEFEGWPNERARSNAYWGSGLGNFKPDSEKGRFLLDYRRRRPADGPTPHSSW
jgi:protein tyrosine/serine phosphatase